MRAYLRLEVVVGSRHARQRLAPVLLVVAGVGVDVVDAQLQRATYRADDLVLRLTVQPRRAKGEGVGPHLRGAHAACG